MSKSVDDFIDRRGCPRFPLPDEADEQTARLERRGNAGWNDDELRKHDEAEEYAD